MALMVVGLLLLWGFSLTWGRDMLHDADIACTSTEFLDGNGGAAYISLFPPGFVCRGRLAGPMRVNLWGHWPSAIRVAEDYPRPSCENMDGPSVDWQADIMRQPPPRYPSSQEAARSQLGDFLLADDTIVDLGFDGLDSHVFGLERDGRLLATTRVTRLSDSEWIAYYLLQCHELVPPAV